MLRHFNLFAAQLKMANSNYVIYCDESRQDSGGGHKCMAIGGLWIPRHIRNDLSEKFKQLRISIGLRGEIKWSKVSTLHIEAYKQILDFFFEEPEIHFRCIVVEHSKVDCSKFHNGDRELGFYKFYYEMLEKWMFPGNRYLVLLDFKKNKGADRYRMLRRVLENKLKGQAWIDDLTVIDSGQSHFAQLTDILTGAVAASWCGQDADRPKGVLAEYLAQKRGTPLDTESSSPAWSKFNIFKIRLQ